MKTAILGFITSICVFLSPTFPLIILVGLFIMADTILGLVKSYILKEDILSRKLARIASKLIIYTAAILLVFGLDTQILSMFIETDLMITKLGAAVLCFIEGFSMDENIRKINNDRGLKYYLTKTIKAVKNLKDGFNSVINK